MPPKKKPATEGGPTKRFSDPQDTATPPAMQVDKVAIACADLTDRETILAAIRRVAPQDDNGLADLVDSGQPLFVSKPPDVPPFITILSRALPMRQALEEMFRQVLAGEIAPLYMPDHPTCGRTWLIPITQSSAVCVSTRMPRGASLIAASPKGLQ